MKHLLTEAPIRVAIKGAETNNKLPWKAQPQNI